MAFPKSFALLLGIAGPVLLGVPKGAFADGDEIPPPPLQAPQEAAPQYQYRIPPDLSDGWKVGDLRKENIDLDRLCRGVERIRGGVIPDVESLLVVRHGRIMLDEYFLGRGPQDSHALYSCTKSVFSTVYGIAQDQGLLGLHRKIYDFYPEERSKAGWDPGKDAITVGMLLSMTSGLDCNDAATTGSGCYQQMTRSPDWLAFCFALPLAHAPGTTWSYNGTCLTLLSNLILQKSGMTMAQYSDQYLLGPLGIQGDSWITGPQGATRVDAGLVWKPRDMAKLGQLYLNKGLWNGKRILSEAWVKEATALQAPPGQAFGGNYGYLWYIAQMQFKGRKVPVFWASGYAGQHILVCPEADLVCVMTADSADYQIYGREENLFEDSILGCFN